MNRRSLVGRRMSVCYWCLHCPRPAWRVGGAPALSRHLLAAHGRDVTPRVQPVDSAGEPIGPDDPDWEADGLVRRAPRLPRGAS